MTIVPLPGQRPDPTTVTLAFETPEAEGVTALLAAGDQYSETLYPPESCHAPSPSQMRLLELRFMVARAAGEAIACVALVDQGGYGEIKRLWVQPTARGLGLAARMLRALEQAAIADGLGVLRLETGIHQPEAIRLYKAAGFVERPPFGDYRTDPLSLFMEKKLPGFADDEFDEDGDGD